MPLEKQKLIDLYFQTLRKLNGLGMDIIEVRKFFERVSGSKGFTPPTVEFMTVLKNYKPLLFHEFKSSLVPDTSMHMLSSIHVEVGQALINLGITDEVMLYRAIKGKDLE